MTSLLNPTRDVKTDAGNPEKAKDRLINLNAKPGAITLDPVITAVIVVDMQNDFGSKGGMFDRAGIDIGPLLAGKPVVRRVPLDGAKEAISKLADELEGYEDLHASAELRRDILRNLAPVVIEEALACAA